MTPFDDEARRCRTAQQLWQAKPVRERLRFVHCLRQLLVERTDALCEAVAADVKRIPWEVAATDILPAAAAAKFLLKNAAHILKPRRAGGRPLWLLDCRDTIHRRPHGLVGVIGTWNYPIYLTLGAILPAFVAGNGVLWKPSENTPQTADALLALLLDAGVEPNLLVKLPGEREAGPQLCEADIDFLHFTGSDAVGRRIAARLGERLILSTLELSGCDAFVVMPDADLDLAARTAWYGTTLNNGQTCIATRRAFVPKPVLDDFVTRLEALVESTPPRPLVTRGQIDQMRRIVHDAHQQGFRVLSRPAEEASVSPIVIVDPSARFASCVEASFSPILSVLSFDSREELLSKVRESPFGLSGAVFANDSAEAEGARGEPAGRIRHR